MSMGVKLRKDPQLTKVVQAAMIDPMLQNGSLLLTFAELRPETDTHYQHVLTRAKA